jgi:ubiquitin C-terminal hydrolase
MPSRFATMERNAPTDFEESQRPVKMMRTDYIPSPVHYFAMMPAPATASSPSKGAVKRKFGALDASLNFATSATKRPRTGCRGGKKRARGPKRPQRPRRAIVDVRSEDALGGSTDAPSGKDTAEVSASTEGDATVSTSEDAIKAEDNNSQDNDEVATVEISPPSVGGDTAEVPVTAEGAAAVTSNEDAVETEAASGEVSNEATISPPSAAEGTAEVPVTAEEDAAVTSSEDAVETEATSGEVSNEATISPPSAAEGTAEVPAAMKEDVMATASELAEALFSAMVGEDTADSPTSVEGEAAAAATECDVKAEDDTDAPADQDTVEVSTSTKENAATSTSECAAEAQNDSNNSSEPVSSSRKSVSGSIESADSSSSSESASSSQKSANMSSETLDTVVSEPEVAPKKPTSTARKKERYVTGLYNHGNQCFANATLQMFDAALDGHDLDLVMGKEESNENFEIRDQEILGLYGKIKAGVQGRIRRFRSEGRLKDINPRKHLRALLSRMRGRKDTPQPESVAPLVFQQVLALGGEDTMFEHLDGTAQEDCYEYFCALMNRATSTTIEESDPAPEDDIGSATRLKSLFGIKSETIKECESGCGWKGPVQYESNDSVSTSVWKSGKSLDIHDMLKKSRKSTCEDQKCPKCGKETLASVTELKEVSDNFVVHINRVEGYEPRKIQTAVELPLKEIPICGKKFMLNAVVRHKGATVDSGHYTAFRRRASEWLTDEKSLWYLINDEDVQAIDKSDVKDNWRGQSAMLLFKAV